jgi:alanyl-tRNA synthetase
MQYNRKDDGTLEDLPTKNVDTGMGLERTLAILGKKKSAYETDIFKNAIQKIETETNKKYGEDRSYDKSMRIIVDHLRSAIMLINEGLKPNNKMHGYVLRRLLRRAMFHGHLLGLSLTGGSFALLVREFEEAYPELQENWSANADVLTEEGFKFGLSLDRGLKHLEKAIEKNEDINGLFVFNLFQSYGFPLELSIEILRQKNIDFSEQDIVSFNDAKKTHENLSKTSLSGKFAGGLAGHSDIEVKYHTATHLLHQALRDVLGPTVFQKGSNITPERLRFDFSFDRKMTPEELKKVEEIVNQKIKADLKVERTYMTYDKAMAMNAIGLFGDKYDKTNVSIYAMGPADPMDPESKDQRERGGYYSLEFCGGPHVEHTNQVGGIKLVKEEAVSAGVRRIRAELV